MEYTIKTTKADEFIDITNIIRQEVRKSGVRYGIAVVFIPNIRRDI